MELRKKSNTNENKSIFSTRQERVQMQVDFNNIGHITSLLTDLYVNPIEATVREVISNAIDTTRRLPKEDRKPISIFIPNDFTPEFVVTDNGEGMNRETLSRVFAQYGASTKGTDLQQIGAFGLGAKAPLSYTSKFSVESTKDGITTEVFLSSTSEGNFCDILDSKETGKPNGTTVTIPVNVDNKNDFYRFKEVVFENYVKFSYDVELNVICSDTPPTYYTQEVGEIKVGEVDGQAVYSKVYGVHRSKEDLEELILTRDIYGNEKSFVAQELGLTLSGWNYTPNKSGRRTPIFYLELVPGMVDFSSSRDEITINERFSSVTKLIETKIADVFRKRQEDFISSLDWNNINTLQPIYSLRRSQVKRFEKKVDGQTVYERILDIEKSAIPLEFAISMPSHRGEYFSVLERDGEQTEHRLMTKVKEQVKQLGDSTKLSFENLLFSKTKIVFISDMPKETDKEKELKTKNQIVNKLKKLDLGRFSSHTGRTYVGTTKTQKEIEKVTDSLKIIDSMMIIPFPTLIDDNKEKNNNETDSILSSRYKISLSNVHRLSVSDKLSSGIQTNKSLNSLLSQKEKNILIIGSGNLSYDNEYLATTLIKYITKEKLDVINLIFVRKTALSNDIALELLNKVDYVYSYFSSENFNGDMKRLIEEKDLEKLELNVHLEISDELKIIHLRGFTRKYNKLKKMASKFELDLEKFLPKKFIKLMNRTKCYTTSSEEQNILKFATEKDFELSDETMELVEKCEVIQTKIENIFSLSAQEDFYYYVDDDTKDLGKELIQIAYDKIIADF